MGSTALVTSSVVGQDPATMIATDGLSVFRTTDGGCNWQTVYTVGPTDYYSAGGLAVAYSVTNIATSHDARPVSKQDVYLALSPNAVNAFTLVTLFTFAPPEFIVASHDGGKTFAMVTPQPTAANPIVPECLSAPSLFLTPATDAKTIYLQCNGGLAQTAVEGQLGGGTTPTLASSDGGVTWSLRTFPTTSFTTDPHRVLTGLQKNELWVSGYWTSPSPVQYYLAVWRSVDGAKTWTLQRPDLTPVTSSISVTSAGLAIDTTPGPGSGRIVVYGATGTYLSTDTGKHWQRLRAVTFTDGTRPPAAAFFLHHTLYVLYAGQIVCKGEAVLVRYPKTTAKPVQVPYPSKWGTYAGWANDMTFSVASHGMTGTGLARFCASSGYVSTPKVLSFRAH